MDRRDFLKAAPAAGLMFASGAAYATVYFTGDAVKRALFPSATRFVDRSFTLTKAQMASITKSAATRVTSASVSVFDAYSASGKLGSLFIDKVYGKHEFITYALAVDTGGAVKGVEVMDYRESYGDQIRLPKWRAQFTGKRSGQPIRIDKEIKNISGATLSCVHMTEGVRRLLATYALALNA
jgi:Na+-translocating ferredoxin:NAD+ oxidoreductase RnfG subunit